MHTVLLLCALGQLSSLVSVSPRHDGIIEVTFSDRDGQHKVTINEYPAEKTQKGDEWVKSAKLSVVSEVRSTKDAKWVTTWQAKDFVNDCEFDLTLGVIDDSIEVTDIDDNGRAEVSFMYRLGCRSDVSPATLKLLMYQGTTKWALRGQSKVKVGLEKGKPVFEGGEVTVDGAFKANPTLLREAMEQWKRNVTEK